MNTADEALYDVFLLVYYLFLSVFVFHLLLIGRVIIWKWFYEADFERCVIDEESCLQVRCVSGWHQKVFVRRFTFFVMPLLLLYLLVSFLTGSFIPYLWEVMLLGYVGFVELLILNIQIVVLGQVMQIGPKGVCYPVSDFNQLLYRSKDRSYSKLDSMEFAVNRKKWIRAPSKSILDWEWTEPDSQLTFTLNCLAPRPKKFTYAFPHLSESEQDEIIGMLDEMEVNEKVS